MQTTGSPFAFSGTIAPTALSSSYRLGLVLVTIAMILVPLVYLSLIVAVGWFLVWHLTTNTGLFDAGSGIQVKLLAYLTPAVASATLLFFMVKPILARRLRSEDPVQVQEAEQPELHALIREICRQVRAPLPARVQLDCQVNASASMRHGILGLFRRDLDLTIGLPLVNGLSVRELSGVLAHEFGHFAQGGGMRLTMVIRVINAWLHRVVHERDEWDDKLEALSKEGDFRILIPMAIARGSVWVSRRALAALSYAGNGISCYMLRQMEFDADSYEVKIAGTGAFMRTMVSLRELSAGSMVAYGQLRQLLNARVVPADLPQLFAECSRSLPREVRQKIEHTGDERTGMFDTHPCDADRVAAAQALGESGALVGGDEPATTLFRHYDRWSAIVTRHHYENNLGIDLDEIRLVGIEDARREAEDHQRTEDAQRGAEDHQRTQDAIEALVGGRVSVLRPLRISLEDVAADASNRLEAALDEANAAVSNVPVKAYRIFEHYQTRRDMAFCAEQLLDAGLPTIDAGQFGLASPTLTDADATQRWALEGLESVGEDLDRFDALVARRLSVGIVAYERRHPSSELRAVAIALSALAEAVPFAVDAGRFANAIAFLNKATRVLGTSPYLRERIAGHQHTLDACQARAFDVFSKAPPPPGALNVLWMELLSNARNTPSSEFLRRLLELYWTCLSHLARELHEERSTNSGPRADLEPITKRMGLD